MDNRPDPDRPQQRGTPRDPNGDEEEYAELDPDTITEDAIEFFEQHDETPTSDPLAGPPG